MANLQDIIKLIGDDDGKAFIMDQDGEVKLVIMGVAEYQKMLLGKLHKQHEDVEEINRQITEAQLQDGQAPAKPERLDLRSEVIDPNFDFDAEVIKPDFDDI